MATVFYSWQSDLPNNTNRNFIADALRKALRDLAKDEEVYEPPREIDTATAGVAGSARIDEKIFAKINAASACVFDVSIALRGETRVSPNPNVLVELGYALKAHPEERVIMVMNKRFGKPEELPFDLRQRQVLVYDADLGADDRSKAKADLVSGLVGALKATFKHNEENRFTPGDVEFFVLLHNEARKFLDLHAEFEDRRLKPYSDMLRDHCKNAADGLRDLANQDAAHARPDLLALMKKVANELDKAVGDETVLTRGTYDAYVASLGRAATDAAALLAEAKDAVRQKIGRYDYRKDKRQVARSALAEFDRFKEAVTARDSTHFQSIRRSMQSIGGDVLRLASELEVLDDDDSKILRPAGHALNVAAIEKSREIGYREVDALIAKLGPLLEPLTRLAKAPGS